MRRRVTPRARGGRTAPCGRVAGSGRARRGDESPGPKIKIVK